MPWWSGSPPSRLPGIAPPSERGKPLLEVKGVTVRFGGLVALNAMTLTVAGGRGCWR